MLVYSIRTLDFVPSRFDKSVYVWLRDPSDVFDFIFTHVDNVKVVAKDLNIWIEYIASIFLIKENDPRQYYIGNECRDHGDQDMWAYFMSTYAKDNNSIKYCSPRFCICQSYSL